MGSYTPGEPHKRGRTVSETLLEAEADHFLDCPNADPVIRAAALLLDCILFALASSAFTYLHAAFDTHLSHGLQLLSFEDKDAFQGVTQNLIFVARFAAIYFQFFWAVRRFGGSPGKLLLGLRVLSAQTGELLSTQEAFFRECLGKPVTLLSLVGLILPFLRKDGRALHDLLAGTVVKRIRGRGL